MEVDKSGSNVESVKNEPGRSKTLCCVCLEPELEISELRKHIDCGCIVCKDCLKFCAEYYSTKVNSDDGQDDHSAEYSKMKCPGCSKVLEYEKEYIQFTSMDDSS